MSKEVINFQVLMEVFYRTIELTENCSNASLEEVKMELERCKDEIEMDQRLMLKIITKFLQNNEE